MNERLQRLKYVAADYVAAFLTWVVFYIFRVNEIDFALSGADKLVYYPSYNFYVGLALVPFFWLFVHYLSGYYNLVFRKSRLSELFTTLISSFFGSLLLFFIIVIDDLQAANYGGQNYASYYYLSFSVMLTLQFLSTYGLRFVITQRATYLIHHRLWCVNTLIVGTGKNARTVAGKLDAMRFSLGNRILGFIAVSKHKPEVDKNAVLGALDDLERLVRTRQVREVIVALDDARNEAMFYILGMLNRYKVEVKYVPNIDEIVSGKWQVHTIYSIPLVSISDNPMSDWQQNLKRVTDILISALALLGLSPLLVLLTARVSRDAVGSVFYRQERLGRHGVPFTIYKFRTMRADAEQDGIPRLSSETDSRITPFGRFLRKYRLDELPQFWNVLRGDMSLVGPRPERSYFIEQIVKEAPYYYLVQRVRPGITSWGMVKYGYADSVEKMIERLEYDIIYIENMSLLIDLKIFIYTLKIIITGKGI